jgi:hypothetical protein
VLVALLLIGLPLVLGAAVLLGDRVVAAAAERRAGEHLAEVFGHPVAVRVLGGRFLPQALRGRYTEVALTGTVRIGDIEGAGLVAQLADVRLPLRELLGRRVSEVACDAVTGRLVLPYSELARLAPIPGLTLAFQGERLRTTAALPVPGISQLARVGGEAVLSLAPGGGVWLRVRGVSVAGLALPGLGPLLPALSVPVPLPPLPFGLRLDELRPTAGGLVVEGSARAAVFRRPTSQDEHLVT